MSSLMDRLFHRSKTHSSEIPSQRAKQQEPTSDGSAAKQGIVEFDAEGKVTRVGMPSGSWSHDRSGPNEYYTQQADTLLHATELLQASAISSVPELTYYTVETPDGALGRDSLGFYTEAPLKTHGLRLVRSVPAPVSVGSVSLTAYGDPMKSQLAVAQLKQQHQYANFVLLMECGRCGYKSPVETSAGAMERQCYCCGAVNQTSRGTVSVATPYGMVEI